MLHMFLHILVPGLVALAQRTHSRARAFAWLMAGMLSDLDHLLAARVYDPNRCSIGFHPLHTALPIACYVLLAAYPKTRLLGVGLCIHILLDRVDCRFNTGMWISG